jgi:Na+/H+ antiporter NhaD/arsenite permease-like protein
MMSMFPALILFAVTYVLMLVFSKYRPYIALSSALIFIVTGMLPLSEIIPNIDLNVLLMIAGTMGLVALFIESRMPALLADLVMEKVPNVQWAAVALALFAGIISAFVDNVATVLMVAPVALEICRKLKTNPVPFIIGIAVSSNLQGAATLVGDTTAIMLGSALDMSFTDFFFYKGKPSMFFAVELGAVISALILYFIFRKEKTRIPKGGERTRVTDYVPAILLGSTILLLLLASFLPSKPDITNGLICCGLLVVGLIYNYGKKKDFSAIFSPSKALTSRPSASCWACS